MLVLAGWSANRQYTIMKSWPTVEAEVIRSEVARTEDSDGNVLYRPSIAFGYKVNGKEYQSFGGSHVSTSNYEATKRNLGGLRCREPASRLVQSGGSERNPL